MHAAGGMSQTANGDMAGMNEPNNSAMHEPGRGMAYGFLEGWSGRFIVLPNVEGEEVVILIEGPEKELEKSLPEAMNVVDSVQWED
jgi:hypothetical protein